MLNFLAGKFKFSFGVGKLTRPQRVVVLPELGEVAVLQPFAEQPIAIFSLDGKFIRSIGDQVFYFIFLFSFTKYSYA